MANRYSVTIDWDGLDSLINEFEGMEKDINKYMYEELNRFKTVPERGVKALTPRDQNDLTKSFTTSKVSIREGAFEFSLGSNLPYALRMHEHQGNWGVRTINKQATQWRGYMPGNKFLENAVKGSEADFDKAMVRVLERLLGE